MKTSWLYRTVFCNLVLLIFNKETLGQQITYPDSCLDLQFYFKKSELKYDTVKEISIKSFDFFQDDSSLNLVVIFKNKCGQVLLIPNEIILDMPGDEDFSIEGVRQTSDSLKHIYFSIEYDRIYGKSRKQFPDKLLLPYAMTEIKYDYPLGFYIKEIGIYKFRLEFLNQYNYIPVEDYQFYKSNWITLKIVD